MGSAWSTPQLHSRDEEHLGSTPEKEKGIDGCSGSTLYPLQRSKILHLVRHGQAFHNAVKDEDPGSYDPLDLFDAHLTSEGWDQVECLRKHVQASGVLSKTELVITSPFLRTMQTACGVFGGEDHTENTSVPPLMVANAGKSYRSAISSLNCPHFLAIEKCREYLGVHTCDKRRSISEYRKLFPAIDFSLIENDEDVLWKPDVRELDEEIANRGMEFLDWLWTRKEKEIAIVTHGGFLRHTLAKYGIDCHPTVKEEITKRFANCELRSMVLVDKSMLGSDPAPTNWRDPAWPWG